MLTDYSNIVVLKRKQPVPSRNVAQPLKLSHTSQTSEGSKKPILSNEKRTVGFWSNANPMVNRSMESVHLRLIRERTD